MLCSIEQLISSQPYHAKNCILVAARQATPPLLKCLSLGRRERLTELVKHKRLENVPGLLAAHRSTVTALRRALESAGIEFINGTAPGVRLEAGAQKEDRGADRGR
jgi:hypothetical protein